MMDKFKKEYRQHPEPMIDNEVYELAQEYHQRCDKYDAQFRFRIEGDVMVHANPADHALSVKHALKVRKELQERASLKGISSDRLDAAIREYR